MDLLMTIAHSFSKAFWTFLHLTNQVKTGHYKSLRELSEEQSAEIFFLYSSVFLWPPKWKRDFLALFCPQFC